MWRASADFQVFAQTTTPFKPISLINFWSVWCQTTWNERKVNTTIRSYIFERHSRSHCHLPCLNSLTIAEDHTQANY